MRGAVHTVPPRNNNFNLENILNVLFPLAVEHQPTVQACLRTRKKQKTIMLAIHVCLYYSDLNK
jgi:hypothetical protein